MPFCDCVCQVDLIEAEKRVWGETIPERAWAIVGRTIFQFFDQDADGLLTRSVFLRRWAYCIVMYVYVRVCAVQG